MDILKYACAKAPTARKIRRVIQASVGRVTAKTFLRVKDARGAHTCVYERPCIHNARVHAPSAMRRDASLYCACACMYIRACAFMLAERAAPVSCRRLSPGSFVSRVSRSAPFFLFPYPLVTPRLPPPRSVFPPALLFFAESRGRKNVGDFRLRSFSFSTSDAKTPRHYATNARRSRT